MTFEILLNPSVPAEDVLRLSNQAQKIYDLLKKGPVSTAKLAATALQYSARLSEIRHVLVRVGLMIDEKKGEGGNNKFQIVPLEKSTFWKKIIQKGEQWKWL